MTYLYIVFTILLTVYGQVVIKWRVMRYGALPESLLDKYWFLFGLLTDPFILSGLAGAFAASLFWMAAMTKLPISYAYPFMGLTFVLVLISGSLFFNEPISVMKLTGVGLILLGIVVSSQG